MSLEGLGKPNFINKNEILKKPEGANKNDGCLGLPKEEHHAPVISKDLLEIFKINQAPLEKLPDDILKRFEGIKDNPDVCPAPNKDKPENKTIKGVDYTPKKYNDVFLV